MVSFGDIYKTLATSVGETVEDLRQEEKEIEDYKEKAAERGEDIISVVTHVKKIKDKHEKKRKEIAQNTSIGGPVKVAIDLNNTETTISKDPPKTTVKPPKKVSRLSGKDSKIPKVSKSTKDETVKVDKPYKTMAGDVTATSEDPAKPYTSLAIIALIGGAIGLGIYFYLNSS